jgi:hypothetical protein
MTQAQAVGDTPARKPAAKSLRKLRSQAAPLKAGLEDMLADGQAREQAMEPTAIDLVAGLKPFDLADLVRQRLVNDRDYAQGRRWVWRNLSSASMVLSLLLSAGTTIVLGLAHLGPLGTLGFIFSALVTVMIAIEPVFDWRAHQTSADQALAAWHQLEDNLAIYVASTPAKDLDLEVILSFDADRREVWSRFS